MAMIYQQLKRGRNFRLRVFLTALMLLISVSCKVAGEIENYDSNEGEKKIEGLENLAIKRLNGARLSEEQIIAAAAKSANLIREIDAAAKAGDIAPAEASRLIKRSDRVKKLNLLVKKIEGLENLVKKIEGLENGANYEQAAKEKAKLIDEIANLIDKIADAAAVITPVDEWRLQLRLDPLRPALPVPPTVEPQAEAQRGFLRDSDREESYQQQYESEDYTESSEEQDSTDQSIPQLLRLGGQLRSEESEELGATNAERRDLDDSLTSEEGAAEEPEQKATFLRGKTFNNGAGFKNEPEQKRNRFQRAATGLGNFLGFGKQKKQKDKFNKMINNLEEKLNNIDEDDNGQKQGIYNAMTFLRLEIIDAFDRGGDGGLLSRLDPLIKRLDPWGFGFASA